MELPTIQRWRPRVAITAVAALVLGLVSLVTVFAQAGPYGASFTVAGKLLSSNPTISTASPQICGQAPANTNVQISVQPGGAYTAMAGATGAFCVALSNLQPGTHAVLVNGQAAGGFVVAAVAPPLPPATGNGGPDQSAGTAIYAIVAGCLAAFVIAAFAVKHAVRVS